MPVRRRTLLRIDRVSERFAEFGRRFRREAVAHDVFGDDARDQELEQIIAAAGFGAAAAHLESAERMPPDDRAGAAAVDVNVAGDQLGFDALDVRRAAREKSAGERVVGAVRDFDALRRDRAL